MIRDRVMALLDYDPETGEFRWKVRRPSAWCVGCIAGTIDFEGYRAIGIDGRVYRASHLAWLVAKGTWPTAQLDHIDLDRSNNRISNLRQATNSQNKANSRAMANNSTGFKGVIRDKRGYRARIMVNGKRYHLGTLKTAEAAHAVYCAEAQRVFGEFARCT